MLLAWVTVTMDQITHDSMLQDIIKVIMVAQTSTMTINRTAMVIKTKETSSEVEVEAVDMDMVVVAMAMVRMSPTHKITPKLVYPKHPLGQ
jgi:heterodisulfide reductase subunit A-like polyferredoxin